MQEVLKKSWRFWRTYGTRALIWRLRGELSKRLGRHAGSAVLGNAGGAAPTHLGGGRSAVQDLVAQRFAALTPLPVYQLPSALRQRVTVVTDSINAGSLFGGVGTALILATLLANRLGANLRVVTRTEPAHAANLDQLYEVYGLKLQGESEFVLLHAHGTRQLIDFSDQDIFITTSWWTTVATLASIPVKQIWYLLQEDERMFYPSGDDQLACNTLLSNPTLQYVINTQLLFDHLRAHGMAHLADTGVWFEPAFPAAVYFPRPRPANAKRRFVFYARPNNVRNLFYLGMQAIDTAITRGVLDPAVWDIVLMGRDIPDIKFAKGVTPERHQNLAWSDYAELVGSIDLGLSLMATPHPSYPPLDLVASGAVVVTNTFANKQTLSQYSPNLLCAEADVESLVRAMAEGVQRSADDAQRRDDLASSGLGRDWETSLAPVLAKMTRAF